MARGAGEGARQAMEKQRRNAIITGVVLALMAIAIYGVVVLKYVVR
jgi:hypothetical protein